MNSVSSSGSSCFCYLSIFFRTILEAFLSFSATVWLFCIQALTTIHMAWHCMASYDFPEPLRVNWSIQSSSVQYYHEYQVAAGQDVFFR